MALTSTEETTLKKIANERIKQDQISAIVTKANEDIQAKQVEIQAILTKKDTDIKAIG